MLYPVEKLLQNRDKVLCVNAKETVRDALVKMVRSDYSQLPVVDDNGNLTGIITEKSITRTYYHVSESVPLFNLTVDNCQTTAVTLSIDQDIFEALDRLQNTYAIVITEGRKPIGLLTHYDTTHFFRNLTEGLIIVEDIETSLRQYIEAVYSSEEQLNQALVNAFGGNGDIPNREYDRLTFGQYLQFVTHKKNWPDFEAYFASSVLFERLMNEVRQIRNQIAHFRGDLDKLQSDALLRARDWLESRPKPKRAIALPIDWTAHALLSESVGSYGEPQLETAGLEEEKYAQLTDWFSKQLPGTLATITFDEMQALLGEPLPVSAREHRSWWTNNTTANRQALAWLSAGWLVEDVDISTATVTFRRTIWAYYQLFFEDIVQQFHSRRPGLLNPNAVRPKSWLAFASGVAGFNYAWAFARGSKLCLELYIDTGSAENNKRYFDLLFNQRQAIEAKLGAEPSWDRLDHRGASRVRLEAPSNIIAAQFEQPELLKQWAVDRMLNFVDTFQPILRELSIE